MMPAMSETGNIVSSIDVLADAVPEVIAGYRAIRSVIDSDGALSVAEKALLVAADDAVCSDGELAASEIARGRAAGLTDDQIVTAASALLLSRGQRACERLLAAAGELAPERPAAAPSDADATDYFLDYNVLNALPPRLAVLADRSAAGYEGYFRMHHGVLRARPEFSKLAELVLCSLNAADLRGDFVAIHAGAARRVGVTDEELLEAFVCAMAVGGVGAWAVAAGALLPG
jgi:alkylhydroperoxidase/carboxymuconolactone decarboxylase family protein YurZ